MPKEYQATHTVPATGLPAWPTPDGTGTPAANLDAGLDIQVTERRADWARIRCSNGWEAWIDGRNLVALAIATPPPPPPPPPHTDAPPPPHVDSPPVEEAPLEEAPLEAAPVDSPPVEAAPTPATDAPAATSTLAWPSGEAPAAATAPAEPGPTPEPVSAPAPEPTGTSPAAAWTSPAPPRPPAQAAPPAQTNAWAAGAGSAVQSQPFGGAQIIALVGSVILAVAAFLPWIKIGPENFNAFDSPANFLFDAASEDEGINLGIVVLLLGAIGIISVFVRPVRWLGIVAGGVAILIGLRFIQQANELTDELGSLGASVDLMDLMKYGVYIVIAGGVVTVVGGILSLRRST